MSARHFSVRIDGKYCVFPCQEAFLEWLATQPESVRQSCEIIDESPATPPISSEEPLTADESSDSRLLDLDLSEHDPILDPVNADEPTADSGPLPLKLDFTPSVDELLATSTPTNREVENIWGVDAAEETGEAPDSDVAVCNESSYDVDLEKPADSTETLAFELDFTPSVDERLATPTSTLTNREVEELGTGEAVEEIGEAPDSDAGRPSASSDDVVRNESLYDVDLEKPAAESGPFAQKLDLTKPVDRFRSSARSEFMDLELEDADAGEIWGGGDHNARRRSSKRSTNGDAAVRNEAEELDDVITVERPARIELDPSIVAPSNPFESTSQVASPQPSHPTPPLRQPSSPTPPLRQPSSPTPPQCQPSSPTPPQCQPSSPTPPQRQAPSPTPPPCPPGCGWRLQVAMNGASVPVTPAELGELFQKGYIDGKTKVFFNGNIYSARLFKSQVNKPYFSTPTRSNVSLYYWIIGALTAAILLIGTILFFVLTKGEEETNRDRNSVSSAASTTTPSTPTDAPEKTAASASHDGAVTPPEILDPPASSASPDDAATPPETLDPPAASDSPDEVATPPETLDSPAASASPDDAAAFPEHVETPDLTDSPSDSDAQEVEQTPVVEESPSVSTSSDADELAATTAELQAQGWLVEPFNTNMKSIPEGFRGHNFKAVVDAYRRPVFQKPERKPWEDDESYALRVETAEFYSRGEPLFGTTTPRSRIAFVLPNVAQIKAHPEKYLEASEYVTTKYEEADQRLIVQKSINHFRVSFFDELYISPFLLAGGAYGLAIESLEETGLKWANSDTYVWKINNLPKNVYSRCADSIAVLCVCLPDYNGLGDSCLIESSGNYAIYTREIEFWVYDEESGTVLGKFSYDDTVDEKGNNYGESYGVPVGSVAIPIRKRSLKPAK